MNTKKQLTVLRKASDDKINVRVPIALKRELERNAKAKGYSKLSKYVVAILSEYGVK